ncbi:MAG: hypothetical protein ABIH23_29100 [bacterium]
MSHMPATDKQALLRFDQQIELIERDVGDLSTHFIRSTFKASEYKRRLDAVDAPKDTVFGDIPERGRRKAWRRDLPQST